jgi:cytochrome c
MKIMRTHGVVAGFAFALATFAASGGAFAADDPATMALMKKNDCTKCHAADKDKVGPSYKSIAAKYKGKADAEAMLTKKVTSGGTGDGHKTIDTKDAKEIKNVVQWVLAQ